VSAGAEKTTSRLRPEKPCLGTEGRGFDSRHLHCEPGTGVVAALRAASRWSFVVWARGATPWNPRCEGLPPTAPAGWGWRRASLLVRRQRRGMNEHGLSGGLLHLHQQQRGVDVGGGRFTGTIPACALRDHQPRTASRPRYGPLADRHQLWQCPNPVAHVSRDRAGVACGEKVLR
jgi:hypothetical protein